MAESLREKIIKGVLWSAAERFSVQGVTFVLGIIMARLLTPGDYGLVGMLAIFTAVASTFVGSGFGTALIRKQDRTEVDDNTVFYFNIVVSTVCYVLLFLAAPYVADFYKQPILCLMLRIIALELVINSFGNIQRVHFTVAVDFKSLAKVTFMSTLVSGVIGVVMAYTGFGVWAIVTQSMVGCIWTVCALWYYSSWRPKWMYSWQSFRELFGFGSKLLAAGLIDTVYKNLYTIVIGKVYNAKDLGFYSRADSIALLPSLNITAILQRVTFPVLSKMQDDYDRLRYSYRTFLKLAAFIVFPLMCGLAAVSFPLIRLLLGEKWMFSATLLQIVCFSMMWFPIHAINLNLLQVTGHSGYFLRLEIIKKVIGVAILCVTVPLGLIAMCWGSVVGSVVCLAVNTYYSGKLIQVGFWLQLRDLMHILLLSLGMFLLTWGIVWWMGESRWSLLVAIPFGGIFYVGGSRLLRFKELEELWTIMKGVK